MLPSGKIVFACERDSAPYVGAWVELTLPMRVKNNYVSIHGAANAEGILVVTMDEVIAWAERNREFALMDYAPINDQWVGYIDARLVDDLTAARAQLAYERFGRYIDYPPNFGEELRRLRLQTAALFAADASVRVEYQELVPPTEIRIPE